MNLGKRGILLALASLATATANADFVNGGFEAGTTSGWNQFGVSVHSSRTLNGNTWLPTEGGYFATTGTLLRQSTTGLYVSFLQQNVSGDGGEELSFDYRRYTVGSNQNQRASVSWIDDSAVTHNETLWQFGSASGIFDSGWQSFSWAVPASATSLTLRFETWSTESEPGKAIIGVDNVLLTIPAPAASLLGVVGLVTTACFRRRAL